MASPQQFRLIPEDYSNGKQWKLLYVVWQVLIDRLVYLTPLGVASLLATLMVQKDITPLLSILG
jgi:hypothetical protein